MPHQRHGDDRRRHHRAAEQCNCEPLHAQQRLERGEARDGDDTAHGERCSCGEEVTESTEQRSAEGREDVRRHGWQEQKQRRTCDLLRLIREASGHGRRQSAA
jgi:hypothetical protein